MAARSFRHPSYTHTAQVSVGSITTSTAAHVYTATLTDTDGSTEVLAYTVTGSEGSTTAVATAFVAAWNASKLPLFTTITASSNAAQVILTADVAGAPFSLSLTATTGAWSGVSTSTASEGVNDYGVVRNWQSSAIPTTGDNVLFDVGAVNILYGLNQSSVAIGDFVVVPGCTSQFGQFVNGRPKYLRIDPDLLNYQGTGQLAMLDIGGAAISPLIAAGTSSSAGRYACYLLGSAMGTVDIRKGKVAIAGLEAETATATTVRIGYDSTQGSDADVLIGAGVTLTNLVMGGGRVLLRCAGTTVTNGAGSTLTTEGTGAITTLHANGTAYPNSSGTITTLHVRGTVDFSKDRRSRSVTNTYIYPGSTLIYHSGVNLGTITLVTDAPGSATIRCVG
jgi:hypothetical protein